MNMNGNWLKAARWITLAMLSVVVMGVQAQVQRPKLVVGLVVDQMRWDYLYYYYDKYGEGGLKRLLNEGYSFDNTLINYVPTITAVGHTSIYTGTTPAIHGIAGNNFAINDKIVYCCSDDSVKGVGSDTWESRMSPRNMRSTTIGDVLKIANDFKSKVIGIALKDRAATLPAGHAADAAYWWDTSVGKFVSSTYYMQELPKWVEQFNKEHHTKPGFDIKTNVLGITTTFKMAEAALENEQLGKHDVTDMLTVSISSTDAIAHAYSTRGKENEAAFLTLDKDLADFLNTLDSKVGKGNYLLFLTADHGGAHNYNFLKKHKIPAGAWEGSNVKDQVNEMLQAKFGCAPVYEADNYQLFINDSTVAAHGHTMQEVKDAIVERLKQDKQYLFVVDNEKIAESSIPQRIKEMIVNGYDRMRSGEITVVTRPQYFHAENSPQYIGTQHGQWNPYDAHIPFVLMGWNVPHGATSSPTHIVDIAPTICQMLHIQMPNGCLGDAKEMK